MDKLTFYERLMVTTEAAKVERQGLAREARQALGGAPLGISPELWKATGIVPKILGDKRDRMLANDSEGTRLTRR